jgi:hypothetical protein
MAAICRRARAEFWRRPVACVWTATLVVLVGVWWIATGGGL